jgi:hypothetical protein
MVSRKPSGPPARWTICPRKVRGQALSAGWLLGQTSCKTLTANSRVWRKRNCGNKSGHLHGSRCCVASLRVLIIWRANYEVHDNLKMRPGHQTRGVGDLTYSRSR